MTTSYLKTENAIGNSHAILVDDVRDPKRCYIVYMHQRVLYVVASNRYTKTCCSTNKHGEREVTSLLYIDHDDVV